MPAAILKKSKKIYQLVAGISLKLTISVLGEGLQCVVDAYY